MELKSRRNLLLVALVIFVSVFGLTYAFFNYYKVSERNLQLITGEIYLRLDDGTEQVLLTNAFPETVEEARSRDDNYVTFSIVGKNTTTNKDIWYEIMLNEGEAVEGKTRLDLADLRIDLSEVYEDKTEKLLIDAMSFEDLNARRIWVDTVLRNTTEEQEKTYKLRVWIREDILISDTDPNATYTTGEYANNYLSVKVSVFGDLTEKANPFQKHYMARLNTFGQYFWPDEITSKRANISKVLFEQMTTEELESAYNVASIKADASATSDSNVKAWLEIDPNDETMYILKIASPGIIVFPSDSSDMFFYFSGLKNITFENIDTSQVTDMSAMFSYCGGLINLNLSSFNTSQVTVMSSMFSNCKVLTSLDLNNFDTSRVTSMSSMFYCCYGLTSINLSSFDTKQVKTMGAMFRECYGLTSLDLSSFDTSQVTDMSNMFQELRVLTSLDLSNFNTSQVTDMSTMFSNCKALRGLDLSNFNTSSVTKMNSMFSNCSGLESLDLTSFDTKQVTDMSRMFYGCNVLKNLNINNFTFNDTLTSYTSIFSTVGSNNATPTVVTVNSDSEQTWILSLSTNYRPDTWTTDNVVIKTA